MKISGEIFFVTLAVAGFVVLFTFVALNEKSLNKPLQCERLGGVPVRGISGSGESFICINRSAIIEVSK